MKRTDRLLTILHALTIQFHHWMVIWICYDTVCLIFERIVPAIHLWPQPAVDWLPWGWVQQKMWYSLIVLPWASWHCFSGDKFSHSSWKFLEVSLAIPQEHTWDWHSFWDIVGDGRQLFSKTGKETGMLLSYVKDEMFSLRVIKGQFWWG